MTVYKDGASIGTTTASGAGVWSFDYTATTLAAGSYAFKARATDLAGNISGDSPVFTVVVDTSAPGGPALMAITTDTGSSGIDGVTSDPTLILSGTAEAGSTVTVYKDGASIGTTTASGAGVWSFDYTGTTLSAGSYAFKAQATDLAGNISGDSAVFTVVVDLTSPTADIVDIAPDPRGTLVELVTINFSEPVSGLTAASFTLTVNGQPIDLTSSAVAQVNPMQFTLDLTTVAVLDGNYVLALTAAGSGVFDAAGNSLAGDVADTWTIELNSVPTDILLSNSAVLENITGQAIGNLTAVDSDVGDTHVFLIGDSRFLLVGNSLSLAPDSSLDRTVETSVSLVVTARDSGTPPRELTKSVVITILAHPFPWQNKVNPLDPRNDGNVIPFDAANTH